MRRLRANPSTPERRTSGPFCLLACTLSCSLLTAVPDDSTRGGSSTSAGGSGASGATGGSGGSGGSGSGGSGGLGGGGGVGGSGGTGGAACDPGTLSMTPKPTYELSIGPDGDVAILGDVSFQCPGLTFGVAYYAGPGFDESVPSGCVALPDAPEGWIAQTTDHVGVLLSHSGEQPKLRVYNKQDVASLPTIQEVAAVGATTTFAAGGLVASDDTFWAGGIVIGAGAGVTVFAACPQGETDSNASVRTFVMRYKPTGGICAMMTAGGATGDTFGDVAVNDSEVLVRTQTASSGGSLLLLHQEFTVVGMASADPGTVLASQEPMVQDYKALAGYAGGWVTVGSGAPLSSDRQCCSQIGCCANMCCAVAAPFWAPIEANAITHDVRGVTLEAATVPDAYAFGHANMMPRVTRYSFSDPGTIWGNAPAEWPSERGGEVLGVFASSGTVHFYVLGQGYENCDGGRWRIERHVPQ